VRSDGYDRYVGLWEMLHAAGVPHAEIHAHIDGLIDRLELRRDELERLRDEKERKLREFEERELADVERTLAELRASDFVTERHHTT
jgi:hypothetical protein